eukprot:SAG11_NODE_433_length_9518_cov_11.247054_4_plen_206_part_00
MISMPALFGREHMIMVFFTGLASGLCLSSFLASPRIGTVPQTTQFAAKEAALAPSGSFESSDAVYKGHDWRTSQTKAVKTLAATPFARCEMHTVQFGDDVIDDWLWFDERDQIAVLPMLAHGENEPEKFLLLRQEKYAYAGSSLATIGGLMEDEETPLSAAQRELTEETGLVCDNWKDLGTYVVSANRGAGHTNPFLARGGHCQF